MRLEGKTVRDFDYSHISSVEYSTKRYWLLSILGILFAAAGYYVGDVNDEGVIIGIGLVVGILLILVGIVWKSETVVTDVVGVDGQVNYKGSRQDLESLLKIIREKRDDTQAVDYQESKKQDFTDTLRKLAELRDQGIITQEEFENKKNQILNNS